MKKECTKWITLCLSPLLFIQGAEAAHASHVNMIYGAEQGRHLNANPNASYLLQLASFKNERYAIDYKNRMASKTSESVRIVHKPQSSAPYHVFIGPLTGDAVVQVSQQLLSGQAAPPRRIAHAHVMPEPVVQHTTQQYSQPARAVAMDKDAALMPRTWTPVLTLSGGPAWGTAGETQTLPLQPGIEKTYIADKISRALGTGEVFLGVQRAIKPTINGQLGLAVAASSNIGLNGNIWENGEPTYSNYQYRVNHAAIMAKGKLIGVWNHPIQPYFSAGLGVGFNRSHNFAVTSWGSPDVPEQVFQSNTTTAFTYTLGLGVQRALATHWQAGMGYEFADWGQNSLARAPGQTMGSGLSLNHLYTNELLFSVTYLR